MAEKILIRNGILVALDDKGTIIDDGAVLIENGRILEVGKTSQVERETKAVISYS